MPSLRIHPEVAAALQGGAPVVALESAVITTGLPRDPLPAGSRLSLPNWKRDQPVNLELARIMQDTVREGGAVPAIVAVIKGDLCIGLEPEELTALATEKRAGKASVTDLAHVMATGGWAGATVSATLAACALLQSNIQNPKSKIGIVRVFATGGIGGVHRHWQQRPDISADLLQLASTPVCVVCSGAKSILDLPATLETLETLGVPVIGYRTDCFPQFQSAAAPEGDDLRVATRVDDAQSAARLCALHWFTLHQRGGVVLANPVPEPFAIPHAELEQAIQQAEQAAEARKITGAARTPFLLAEIARLTNNRSLDANLALLLNNACLAAELAVALAREAPAPTAGNITQSGNSP